MSYIQSTPASSHFSGLTESYKFVSDKTWLNDDFALSDLETSRELFEAESLEARIPRPKPLEVYALLSGLPFVESVINSIRDVQSSIRQIIGSTLNYMVHPQNLGLEYCVFKWPDSEWKEEWREQIEYAIRQIDLPTYQFDVGGVQINPDGCVVARGFDHNRILFKIREHMKAALPFLPARQSGWAHVPLGRILEPVGVKRFAELAKYIQSLDGKILATTEIDTLRFIHETRWYMEERVTLNTYSLHKIKTNTQ